MRAKWTLAVLITVGMAGGSPMGQLAEDQMSGGGGGTAPPPGGKPGAFGPPPGPPPVGRAPPSRPGEVIRPDLITDALGHLHLVWIERRTGQFALVYMT